jgi:hypothetical protein
MAVVVELAPESGLAIEATVELGVGVAFDVVVGGLVVAVVGWAGALVVDEPAAVPAFVVPVPVDGLVVGSAPGSDEVGVVSSDETVTTPRPMTAKG